MRAKGPADGARLVGIFGTGRNGSTLLMRLLDASPGLWVYPAELRFLTELSPSGLAGRLKLLAGGRRVASGRLQAWARRQIAELETAYLDRLVEPVRAKDSGPIPTRPVAGLAAGLEAFLDGVRAVYDDRAQAEPPLLAYKSIEVRRLPSYARVFPAMRFVHIVRDPASTYASLKRTDLLTKRKPFWYQGGDILRIQIERRWLPHVRFILERRVAEPTRHRLVRYEDLCRQPAEVIGSLCAWLGVDPPSRPGVQTVLGGKLMTELPRNPSQAGVKTPPRVVADMAEAFGYEEVLTSREREWIAFRTGALARRLGYGEPLEDGRRPRRLELLRKWVPVDRWERMNAGSWIQMMAHVACRRLYMLRKVLSPLAGHAW